MWAGEWLTHYMTPSLAKLIGAVILIVIGCLAVLQFWRSRKDDRESVNQPEPDPGSEASPAVAAPVSTVWRIELKRLGLVIHILRRPQAADMDSSGTISSSEAVLLGSALSLDAFGAGLGAAMVGFSPLLTSVLIACSSGIFLLYGLRVGLRLSAWKGMRTVSLLPGLILIMMGITRLL
jgi:putative sporulation protein YtaF